MKILLKFNEIEKLLEVSEEFVAKNNLLENMYEVAEESNCKDSKEYLSQYKRNNDQFIDMIIDVIENNFSKVNREFFDCTTYLPRDEQKKQGIQFRIKSKDTFNPLLIGYNEQEVSDLICYIIQKIKIRLNGD
jgi:hypothetical protein